MPGVSEAVGFGVLNGVDSPAGLAVPLGSMSAPIPPITSTTAISHTHHFMYHAFFGILAAG